MAFCVARTLQSSSTLYLFAAAAKPDLLGSYVLETFSSSKLVAVDAIIELNFLQLFSGENLWFV